MSWFYEQLTKQTHSAPEKPLLIEGETHWSYGDFLAQVDLAARAFAVDHIQAGDKVGLMLFNQKEFLVCFYALRKLGAVAVPINLQLLPEDLIYVLKHAGIGHLVVSETFYPQLAGLPLRFIVVGGEASDSHSYESFLSRGASREPVDTASVSPSDLGILLYTSGTTGHPKGVMLSEGNLCANMAGIRPVFPVVQTDRMVLALPLFHAFGLIVALAGISVGSQITLIPRFHPKQIVEAMVRDDVTVLPLVPTLFTVLLDILSKRPELKFPHLRYCISGGAALPEALLHRIEAEMHTLVIEGYGMTETSPVLCVNDHQAGRLVGSVGKPLCNVQLKIVDEAGHPLPTGEVGEIWVKGDNVMLGYYQQPDETREVLNADGWLKTGDLGHLDADGNVTISGGRKKDLIIKAGENISPMRIENVLYQHPAIAEAAVVGMPDPKMGEDILAFVTLKEGAQASESDVLRFCRTHLTPGYVPAAVRIVAELPKNATGKIMKKQLKQSIASSACG